MPPKEFVTATRPAAAATAVAAADRACFKCFFWLHNYPVASASSGAHRGVNEHWNICSAQPGMNT